MPSRILSISYDPMLLQTRQHLLQQKGYAVVSAEGFTEAMERCQQGGFDLAVMGHSIPHRDKEALIASIKQHCPVPVIALLRVGEKPLAGAAASADPMNPGAFLEIVDRLLSPEAQARQPRY